ncbi:hypothetical protein SKAU_G00367980 [Synaphobranchus kaupii]|uniref:MRN complex-interacting protein N-terminal domain-containing protein n=1 Tax=Synaphobranchus kaupii TaxID=118154 RepID=A0A9Q1IFI4_SYNKA|nr:hypothetical protein SKAU_G00367980 [Synaphobranchus kaupii]
MVQEFHVLGCFSCQMFQVHQVKKSKKWNCKMCGEKQSLVKVYGRGSGADCRRHVQKLNSLRGELHETEHAWFSREPEGEQEELQEEGDEGLTCGNEQGVAGAVSRWGKYLSSTGEEAGAEEAEEEENIYTDRNAYRSSRPAHARHAGKRKRSWAFSPPPGESAHPDRGGAGQSADEGPWSGARQRTQCEGKRDSHPGSWAASKITHDTSVTSRPPPAAEAPPPPGASRVEPEVTSSKWSRFLSVRREDEEEEEEEEEVVEEEAPERDTCAGTFRGRVGSGEPLGFPSVPSPVFTGRFEEHGHFRVREEAHLTNRECVGNSARSPENEIDSLKFSIVYRGTQKVANDGDHLGHLNSGLTANAPPVCPQNLSLSKPHPSLHSLFQTDEDFDDTF